MLFKFNEKFSLNSFERKLNKLKRDPDLFIKDMISNKKEQVQEKINKISPIKGVTKNKFTIVSAVYNVSKYLDDYFESIGTNIEELSVSHSARALASAKYVQNWANNYEYKGLRSFVTTKNLF